MRPINEDSAATFTIKFRNNDGNLFTPQSAQYRLRDVSNDKVLRDWTAMPTLASEVALVIPAELHVINNNRLSYQEHALAVQADTGLDTQYSEEVRYKVKNLKGFK